MQGVLPYVVKYSETELSEARAHWRRTATGDDDERYLGMSTNYEAPHGATCSVLPTKSKRRTYRKSTGVFANNVMRQSHGMNASYFGRAARTR
jgi:hypothetical protein